MLTRLAPLTLMALLLSAPAFAELKPPAGYYAAVGQRDGKAPVCPAVPQPYTGELQFTSKYEGSDSARATLNRRAENNFRKQTAHITRLEKEAGRMITGYMRWSPSSTTTPASRCANGPSAAWPAPGCA